MIRGHLSRRGFTMLELLVVLAIIGLLASLALPRLSATKQRAFMASMISDLKTLTTAQEAFHVSYHDYAGGVAGAEVPGPGAGGRVSMTPSPDNVIVVTRHAGSNGPGWSATVTNPGATNPDFDVCGVYVGHDSYSPNAAVYKEGTPVCY